MIPSFVKQLTANTFVIKLDDIQYEIYRRAPKDNGFGYSVEQATLATDKIFSLEKPLVYYRGGSFYMNKIYPHTCFLNEYTRTVLRQKFGWMCLGEDTRSTCANLAKMKNFDSLKIKLEDRLTTASTNDCYVNYASFNFDETKITICGLCGTYMTKSSSIICSACRARCEKQIGEVTEYNINSIKNCRRCGYYRYRFQKQCMSHLCLSDRR